SSYWSTPSISITNHYPRKTPRRKITARTVSPPTHLCQRVLKNPNPMHGQTAKKEMWLPTSPTSEVGQQASSSPLRYFPNRPGPADRHCHLHRAGKQGQPVATALYQFSFREAAEPSSSGS